MKGPLVIYHGGCRDGFCAAWIAHQVYPDAEFHAGYYGQDPPDVAGRQVLLLDFSYPRLVLDAMHSKAASMLVLDHHKTAEESLRGALYAVFDMEQSGAGLTWRRFFPSYPVPWIVRYVEDRDLWWHALPHSREVNAYISALPFEFRAWSDASRQSIEEIIPAGGAVLMKTEQYVREVAKNARRIMFEGYAVPIVNAPQIDISELLDHLAQGEPFALGWWQRADGIFQYSLRSHGEVDVSVIAKRYAGGGHRQAAGFPSPTLLFSSAEREGGHE